MWHVLYCIHISHFKLWWNNFTCCFLTLLLYIINKHNNWGNPHFKQWFQRDLQPEAALLSLWLCLNLYHLSLSCQVLLCQQISSEFAQITEYLSNILRNMLVIIQISNQEGKAKQKQDKKCSFLFFMLGCRIEGCWRARGWKSEYLGLWFLNISFKRWAVEKQNVPLVIYWRKMVCGVCVLLQWRNVLLLFWVYTL